VNRIYAIIPARGGSKGVPGKNIKPLAGFPLIAYSVVAAIDAKVFDKVFVSTDDENIAAVARRYGADVPFLRPAELAQDKSPDRGYIEHAIGFFRNRGEEVSTFGVLRPTTPLRNSAIVAAAVSSLRSCEQATGLRSVHPLPEPPQKMMGIENGWLTGLFPHDPRPEYYNLPRQSFPPAFHPNGYIDIVRAEQVEASTCAIFGARVLGFITPVSTEVDTIEEFDLLEYTISLTRPKILDLLKSI
jgi:CMP-N-acetylneuraminic acid synthetase